MDENEDISCAYCFTAKCFGIMYIMITAASVIWFIISMAIHYGGREGLIIGIFGTILSIIMFIIAYIFLRECEVYDQYTGVDITTRRSMIICALLTLFIIWIMLLMGSIQSGIKN